MQEPQFRRGPALIAGVLFLTAILFLAYLGLRPQDDKDEEADVRSIHDRVANGQPAAKAKAADDKFFEVNKHCMLHYLVTPQLPERTQSQVKARGGKLVDLIFIHGSDRQLQSAEFWQPLINKFKRFGQTEAHNGQYALGDLIRVSMPGHGKSTGTPDNSASALHRFLLEWFGRNEESGGERSVILVARSAGARHLLTVINTPSFNRFRPSVVGIVLIAPAITLGTGALNIANLAGSPNLQQSIWAPLLLVFHSKDMLYSRHTEIETACKQDSVPLSTLYIDDEIPTKEKGSVSRSSYHTPEIYFSIEFINAFFTFLKSLPSHPLPQSPSPTELPSSFSSSPSCQLDELSVVL